MKMNCSLNDGGLLVVERNWNELIKINVTDFNFKGIEGVFWPDIDLEEIEIEDAQLGCINDIDDIVSYYQNIRKEIKYECDLLYCIYAHSDLAKEIEHNKFHFLGLDYGYFCSAWNYYSIILNEILFGKNEIFLKYKAELNGNLLFNGFDVIKIFESERAKIINENMSEFEVPENESEFPKAISIWKYRD